MLPPGRACGWLARRVLISDAMVMNACSTLLESLADVSRKGMPSSFAKSCTACARGSYAKGLTMRVWQVWGGDCTGVGFVAPVAPMCASARRRDGGEVQGGGSDHVADMVGHASARHCNGSARASACSAKYGRRARARG